MSGLKKTNWLEKESLRLIIIALPFVFLGLFWPELPSRIPLHWNLQGEADGYGSKWAFLGLAGLNVLLFGLFLILPHLDPKSKNYVHFANEWHIIQVILHLFITYLFFIVGLTALGYGLPVILTIKYGLVGLFLLVGNYLGTVRPNSFIGIKTPWTISSDYVWHKTHRFTAQVWVLSSLLLLIFDFWHQRYPWAFFVYLGLLVVAPVVYSYLLYKKQPEVNPKK
ncbi:immunity protein SdpI [Adhaeribacter aerolatus]|uniref:Immunity protein SdpI n=1 Tax=Adhaeribacter aerolatus TaxID=670289 RepID=A0A512B2M8_9BACT|nr:SdpI family protein [Adhaeribacter aerolatus]GEO06214.1 immunity protein SdpI [Adhaeribacter aerolatus]